MDILRLAVTGDLHLGHRQNDTASIIANLDREFSIEFLSNIDLLVLEGDVYDRLLTCPSNESSEIDSWIARLLRRCKITNTTIIVVDGTDTHDYKQSKRFVEINNDVGNIGADLIYARDLSIVYIERFNIYVLLVPDEIDPDPEKILLQVKELMSSKGIKQVDFAFMHGAFTYQLPPVAKCCKHDEESYLALVKYLIFINHVHVYSAFDRIIAPGSFDRLIHGDEIPKGFIKAEIYLASGDHYVTFVENHNAKIFITVDCIGLSLEDTIAKIDFTVKEYCDKEIHVRVRASRDNPIFSHMSTLVQKYPFFRWTKDPTDPDLTNQLPTSQLLTDDSYSAVAITKDNIMTLLIDRLTRKSMSDEIIKLAKNKIQELA